MLRPRRLSPTLLALTLAACGAPAGGRMDDAAAALDGLIGDAACTHDDQCHTIAVGVQACGGPAAYRAWSSRRTSADALRHAVEDFNRAQAASRRPGAEPSTCRVLDDPGARCEPLAAAASSAAPPAGRCRLRPQGQLPTQ